MTEPDCVVLRRGLPCAPSGPDPRQQLPHRFAATGRVVGKIAHPSRDRRLANGVPALPFPAAEIELIETRIAASALQIGAQGQQRLRQGTGALAAAAAHRGRARQPVGQVLRQALVGERVGRPVEPAITAAAHRAAVGAHRPCMAHQPQLAGLPCARA